MLTRHTAKLIKQLQEKKYRSEYGVFLVEGEKKVVELISSDFTIDTLLITHDFYEAHKEKIKGSQEYTIIEKTELENLSTLESNSAALAVVKQKEATFPILTSNQITLALDSIRDPGNLGTIIRIADWYGIKNIIASEGTVDFYNPKVIAASMGSFMRVSLFYTNLSTTLQNIDFPIVGAYLDGESVHTTHFPQGGILLLGSESHGINKNLESYITKKITIPAFGKAESLNVAAATGIILDNWTRVKNQ